MKCRDLAPGAAEAPEWHTNCLTQRMDLTQHVNSSARILIVDDDALSAELVARTLEHAGYAICITICDPSLAAERFLTIRPDLVLLDLHMEPISGIKVLERINSEMEPRERPPVLVLTGDTSAEAKHGALAAGATDFLSKPVDSIEMLLRIQHMLTARELFQKCQIYSQGLERLVDARTAELQKKTHDLEQTVAELKQTQHQVVQQERLRALGTMASGIAHDLNNGLSLVLGYGDMLLSHPEKFADEAKKRHFLEQMVAAGRDTVQMVKRLREFYRPSAVREERQAVNVSAVVEESIALTAPKWQALAEAHGATIRIAKDLRLTPVIAGAPAELREVLTNLIFNAVDAMPGGGELKFRTYAEIDAVCIEVTDTGTGMTEDTRRTCLEPFYTTKGDAGSGLGLAVSYGIIRRHGGTIEIESRLNKGTTFKLSLPLPDAPLPIVAKSAVKPVSPLRVLLVDDHAGIREIVSAYLAEDRHTVDSAADAKEAMQMFRADRYDLVITDRAMPEINGDELAAAIKRIQPNEPVIMLTGFADLMNETGQRSEDVDLVLSKPARLQDLRKAIVEVMAERPAA